MVIMKWIYVDNKPWIYRAGASNTVPIHLKMEMRTGGVALRACADLPDDITLIHRSSFSH